MPAAETPVAYLGIDVGKSSHSACALDAGGGVAFRAELANRPDDIDRLLERAGSGALVVVDQKRNIGALVLARAHAHGNPCAYLPGYAEKQARGMFPGIAKTDAIDAEVIARTALGVPRALRPAPEEPEGTASLRILSSQREFASSARTRAKNRLRATLLEADPALEGAVDPSSRWQVSMLAEFGGAAGCSAAGWRRFSNAARRAGAPAAGARRLWEALLASSRSGRRLPAGEDVAVRILAREIASLDADIEELDSLVADSLAGDEVYECLLTVPGIGPKTAAALVTSIDISAFRGARRARELLRRGAVRQALREQHQVDVASARREQAAQEPAHIQLQLPHRHGQQVREVLRGVQGEGDEAQQGAEGGREEEAQGHLRDHARRRPVRGLAGGGINRRGNQAGAPDARMRHAEMARSTRLTKL